MEKFGLSNTQFEWTYLWVYVFSLLPLFVIWLWPALRRKSTALATPNFGKLIQASGLKAQDKAWVSKRNFWQWLLLVVIWLLILTAMAGPKLVAKPKQRIKTARSFLIAADMSFSMDTRDYTLKKKKVSRWKAVQNVLGDFIDRRQGDRMGLLLFASNPYIQTPLTTDLKTVNWMLKEAEVGMAGQMTGIGDAVSLGIKILDRDTIPEKVLLLITDGVDSGTGLNPLDAATLAKRDSIKIYTLGVGDPRNKDMIDEKMMTKLSEVTGGEYFRANNSKDLETISKVLDRLEPAKFEDQDYKPEIQLFIYPALLALILSMILLIWLIVNQKLISNRNRLVE